MYFHLLIYQSKTIEYNRQPNESMVHLCDRVTTAISSTLYFTRHVAIKIEAKIIDSLGATKQQMWQNNKDVLSFFKYIS